jgi:hypothetical protein
VPRHPFLLAIATAVIAAGAVALTASSASAQTISDRAQAPPKRRRSDLPPQRRLLRDLGQRHQRHPRARLLELPRHPRPREGRVLGRPAQLALREHECARALIGKQAPWPRRRHGCLGRTPRVSEPRCRTSLPAAKTLLRQPPDEAPGHRLEPAPRCGLGDSSVSRASSSGDTTDPQPIGTARVLSASLSADMPSRCGTRPVKLVAQLRALAFGPSGPLPVEPVYGLALRADLSHPLR